MRVLSLFAAALLSGVLTVAETALTITPATVTIREGEQPVLRYRYGGVDFKPYVDFLTTPSGVNILRDAPHDHVHHHGLMFAIMINNTNFWEESGAPGQQQHVRFTGMQCHTAEVSIDSILQWNGHPDNPPVDVTEHREIRYLPEALEGARLYTWKTHLMAAAPATLGGAHYHGLGMRFVESMDKAGVFRFGGAAEGEVVRGTERLTPGMWAAYTAPVDGKPVTVAMFDHPENRRPVLWFTMLDPFSYLSATVDLKRHPLELDPSAQESGEGGSTEAGDVAFVYGAALWDGEAADDAIEAAYAAWAAATETGR